MSGFPVRFDGVRYRYGEREALRGVTVDLRAGEQVTLLGRNGAGKTTLARLVIGLAKPERGRVLVGDWDTAPRAPEEMARRVGFLFQHADHQLFARAVREDVAFGPRRLGLSAGEVAARVRRALAELVLDDVAGEHPYDLPAPRRKLVALAGVLALEPGVLVLDEPTAGLDTAGRLVVIRALSLRAAAGVTAIVISHDLGFAAEVAERAIVLSEGRVAVDGPAAELLADGAALAPLGLAPPAAARLAAALDLPGRPIRFADCAAVLRARCAELGRPV